MECVLCKSNNAGGDWLQSSPTDMLLVSSRQRQRLYRYCSVIYKNYTLSELYALTSNSSLHFTD